MSYRNIPEELRARPQWVVWKRETNGQGELIKPPYRADRGGKASSTDPNTWTTFEIAVMAAENGFAGIGFALSPDDPFCFVDLDGAVSEEIHPAAREIVQRLDSYTERSQSSAGLHVLIRATLNGRRNRTAETPWGDSFEVYDRARFAYLTGEVIDGRCSIEDRQLELEAVQEMVWRPREEQKPTGLHPDDHELLARAFKAKNGKKLRVLYEGDTSGHKSDSEADLALAGGLAFWIGPNPERIERLMRASKLARPKWDKHRTYLRDTIERALEGRTEFWAGAERDLTDLTVEDILAAAGVDEDAAPESLKDVLKLLKGGPKIADRIVELVKEAGVEFFHDENRQAYAMMEVDGHVETHRVGSREFSLYVRNLFHREHETVLPTQGRRDAEGLLEARAVFDSPMLPVHLRVAGEPSCIYIDLGDEAWRAVRITAEGWEVLQRHSVRFRRTRGMAPLPIPEPGGSLDDLCDLLNLEGEADRRLTIGWILDAARPGTPFSVLELTGEEGTAKSTAARATRAMIDPSTTPLRRCPTKSDDLFVGANSSWVVAFDNVSEVQQWLSDDLCRLATGGGQSKRELYTDEGEHLIDVRRPVLINGIEEIATRGDLLRRTLRVELPTIEDKDRLSEDDFWAAFEAIYPRLFGALCDALSCALRRVGEIELDRMPSMADLAKWVTAAEPALGWPDGAFMEAYQSRRDEAYEAVIESELAGPYIKRMCETGFEGTAGELLESLDFWADGNTRKRKEWPKSPRKLTGIIQRLAPALRKLGYTVHRPERTKEGRPWILGTKDRD
jgi:primase/DNA polymerase family protein